MVTNRANEEVKSQEDWPGQEFQEGKFLGGLEQMPIHKEDNEYPTTRWGLEAADSKQHNEAKESEQKLWTGVKHGKLEW